MGGAEKVWERTVDDSETVWRAERGITLVRIGCALFLRGFGGAKWRAADQVAVASKRRCEYVRGRTRREGGDYLLSVLRLESGPPLRRTGLAEGLRSEAALAGCSSRSRRTIRKATSLQRRKQRCIF